MSTEIKTQQKTELKLEPMYKVILHNDDKTPYDFVISVLVHVFEYDELAALELTHEVHNSNYGVAAVYTKEVAEHKKSVCDGAAMRAGYPFKVSVVPEE